MTDKEWNELCDWAKTVSDTVRIHYDLGEIQIDIRNLTYSIFIGGHIFIVYEEAPFFTELRIARGKSSQQIKAIIENLL